VISDELARRLQREQLDRQHYRDELAEHTKSEFINGEVFVHSPVKWDHTQVCRRVIKLLDVIVSTRKLGAVGFEKCLVGFTRNDYEPDVVFWRKEIRDQFTNDLMIFPPPDLVVEVLSPSTEKNDRGVKMRDYAAHGVSEYWIIDPDQQVLEQYVLKNGQFELTMKSGSGDVRFAAIPGAVFPVKAIFEDEQNRAFISTI
jgi:Uma2 family endonuclease